MIDKPGSILKAIDAPPIAVDVVVPVFNADAVVRRCLESVLRYPQKTPFDLLVIDDASTEPSLARYLEDLAARDKITLLRNASNLGFVRSANLGMGAHADRDVILLNSDTQVANDWLDRLRTCAYREPNVATVTPFSNNATICSFPVFCADNPLPMAIDVAELDAIFAHINAGVSIEIPTGVGFCMYIRRDCAAAIGLFDDGRFGRGYGEENDFCRRALKAGWRNILCADTFVFHEGNASFGSERSALAKQAERELLSLHPDYLEAVRAFIRSDPVAPLRRAVEIELARTALVDRPTQVSVETVSLPAAFDGYQSMTNEMPVANFGKPIQLHVIHDLGGGIERWCRDYCRADTIRTNLILKPFCRGHAAGEGLMLYADIDDAEPIGLWIFEFPFEVSVVSHGEYARVVRQIIERYEVGALIVSSLIGHSLDILTTGLPTVVVAHDYFPSCPAINLHYDGVCQHCDDKRMLDCMDHNPDFNPFVALSGLERIELRERWLRVVVEGRVTVVTPSRIVWEHLVRLFPALSRASSVTIPHGTDTPLVPLTASRDGEAGKLKVVILGMLSVAKGLRLLDAALDRLTPFADIHLVGAQEVGESYIDRPGVTVVSHYTPAELQQLLQDVSPDVALLLSVVPETFSYTLTELMQLGIPPVVTRVGAFAERILDGETGYLIEPTADALVTQLQALNQSREGLVEVRKNLQGLSHRTTRDMVADYHRLLPHFGHAARTEMLCQAPDNVSDPLSIRQAVTMTAMWKQIKRLNLQLTVSRETRPRMPGPVQIADSQRRTAERLREMAEHQRTIAEQQRAIAEHQRALAEIQLERERQRWLEQANEMARKLLEREQAAVAREDQIRALVEQRSIRDKQLAEILASTSWRLSSPVRALGTQVRRLRLLGRCLLPIALHPATIPSVFDQLLAAWRFGGMHQLKLALLGLQTEAVHQSAWQSYRRRFAVEVRPAIDEALAQMVEKPLISIIVPTYNTPKPILLQMLDSVRGQLYPHWELCIADDGSSASGVRKLLKEYAKNDSRIKLHFSDKNRGVSHASNRALELATGSFVILLDHDDVLEEQALFRVAQAMVSEAPDMLYSDEIMVSPDMGSVLQYAHRPAFSPEFLRSHPYIVHMVGFRTELLRKVGGFDENLRISQDYDLILRVTEKARTIVHVPEFLYRWRIHGDSAGRQKMDEVMRTSKALLQGHLQRCGEAGTVNDGAGFNLFDIRYPLSPALRVAIVIPTKNHGDLVRQCVDSIRTTVRDIAYDVVVIDHESDDEATLEYLASVSSSVRVLRYVGPFNFSAINNWAVAQLGSRYSHYLFCNNDIEATDPGWLGRMLELGQKSDVGIVGAQLLYPDRLTIQHAGVCVGAFGAAEHYAKFIRLPDIPRYPGFSEILASNHEVSAVTAACLLIRREAFDAVSGFDEALAVGFGDVDLCLRVGQLGYRILYSPHASLLHHESFTRGKTSGVDPHPQDSALFRERWGAFLHAGDPYFHPALNQNSVAWQMRSPMRCGFDIRRRVWRRVGDTDRQSFCHSE